jgi:hypothetical protein
LENKYLLEHVGSDTSKNEQLKITLYYNIEKTSMKIEAGVKKGFSKVDYSSYSDNWSAFFKIRITEGNI